MTVLGLSLLSCTHCEAAFPTVPTLNDHIEREHPKHSSRVLSSAVTGGMSGEYNSTAANGFNSKGGTAAHQVRQISGDWRVSASQQRCFTFVIGDW